MKQLYKPFLLILIIAFSASSCDLNDAPFDGKPDEQALNTVQGLQSATYGNYQKLVGSGYANYCRYWFEMAYASDDLSLSGTTTDDLYFVYNYDHTKNMSNIRDLWRYGYQIIFGANQVIENIEAGDSKEKDQLLGENLFLRAMVHFQLVTVFGRPYTQGADNPGIPIRDNTKIDTKPPRNTVGEVYKFVVNDLKKAADLMTVDKSANFASKQVANALLSRVYLYMGENELAISYANKVIDSGKYHLLATQKYKSYFTYLPENNEETIFAIKHTKEDDHGYGAIGSLYLKSPDGVGYGEMYASKSYRDLLDKYPDDARHSFIQPKYKTDDQGNIQKDSNGKPIIEERNGYPIWYINKFSYQSGISTLSSPVILRFAEMFLNRAEAEAKMGQNQKAIDDVNRIRQRAGLTGNELYTTGDLKGHDSVLDVVLEERRLEFAFEAQRKFDLFRNNRPLVRDYPGTHLNPSNPGVDVQAGTQIVEPDNPRAIFFIPETEIELNPKLTQNP